jgi:hypothetical protein
MVLFPWTGVVCFCPGAKVIFRDWEAKDLGGDVTFLVQRWGTLPTLLASNQETWKAK